MPLLTIFDIDSPIWLTPPEVGYQLGNGIHIWRVHIPSNIKVLDGYHDVLSETELSRAGEYQRVADRIRFIVSRVVLRKLLGHYTGLTPNQITINNDHYGKPYIANANITPIHFNLSHSGDLILLGFSTQPIGVDIEFINPDFPYDEVLNNYFSPKEIEFVNRNSGRDAFYKLWTRKEAYLKAIGKGISDDLMKVPCLDGIYEPHGYEVYRNSGIRTISFNTYALYSSSITASQIVKGMIFYNFI